MLSLTCLCISHGNAEPDLGFSENKRFLDGREAVQEETIVAIRFVRDATQKYGSLLDFPMNGRLMQLVQNSHRVYEVNQNLKKMEAEANKKKKVTMKKL